MAPPNASQDYIAIARLGAFSSVVAALIVGCARPPCVMPTAPVDYLDAAELAVMAAADTECDAGGPHCAELQRIAADLAEQINTAKLPLLE